MSVTGWDDTDAAAAGLTTAAHNLRAQGARCAQLVLGEEAANETGPIEWRLVVRDSTRR